MTRFAILFCFLLVTSHSMSLAYTEKQTEDSVGYGSPLQPPPTGGDFGLLEYSSTNNLSTCLLVNSSTNNSSTCLQKKRPWLAVAEVGGFHLGLLAFDRFVINGAYAHVTLKTIRRNLKMTEWYWDSDLMRTNLFNHPYHGMLYYNAGRSNGMTFWESSLYAASGSLLWELLGEMELPSVNDLVSTSFGGIAIGEAAHRLSDMVIDDSSGGGRRVVGELAGGLLNPMRGLTRVLTGEAWRRKPYRTTVVPKHFEMAVNTGWRHVSVAGRERGCLNVPFFDIDIDYGDAVVEETENKPFDHFVLSLGLAAGGHQQPLNRFSLRGRLFGTPVCFDSRPAISSASKRWNWEWGLYQHFTYYYSDAVGSGEVPYKFSEAATIGTGIVCERSEAERFRFRQEFFVNGILLGGMMSDYSGNLIDRNYNIGSGFSLKSFTSLRAGEWFRAGIELSFFRLFTWLDFRDIDQTRPSLDWSTQGDASQAALWMVAPQASIILHKGLSVSFSANYFNRHTRYRYLPSQHSHTWEMRIGVGYRI